MSFHVFLQLPVPRLPTNVTAASSSANEFESNLPWLLCDNFCLLIIPPKASINNSTTVVEWRCRLPRYGGVTREFLIAIDVQAVVVDVSVRSKEINSFKDFKFVSRKELLSTYLESENQPEIQIPDSRFEALAIMNKALTLYLKKGHQHGSLAGVVGLGGSGGMSMMSSTFRSLLLGLPKIIIPLC
ncbi:hypothetical protein L2E82_18861 [Cichorium intybus]|uniref:Uncharacterized protein n=1 Tax=Cichorium intybus TaxID=13427 RepID=A0ACB9FAI9_CICIN|nr:hypothetical protein L2E82_18861 [Cichorium intybus]